MPTVPRTLGVTGLRHAAGRIIEDELAPELKFPSSITTYQKMKSDPIIAGSLFMIKQFIRKVDWDISPAGGINATDSAKQKADIVRDSLFVGMERSFDQLISDICSFIENGFGFHEPTYKLNKDGEIVWKDFPARPPTSIKGFKFDKHGYVKAIEQYQVNNTFDTLSSLYSTTTKLIPYDRLLHFRTDSEKNNPLGRSILKNAYKAWYFKTKLEEHEAIGVEREMNGVPYLRCPSEYMNADPTENPEQYAVFEMLGHIVTNMRNNEQAGLILPSDVDENGKPLFSFELISSNGTRSLDTSKIIERYDYRIAQSLLSDFLLMGSTSTGSFALSDNKVNTFVQSLEAYLEVISEQFNRKAIPILFEMNGWDMSEVCQLVHKPVASATRSELADLLQKGNGYLTPEKGLENTIRDMFNLPHRDDSQLYIDKPVPSHQADSQRIGMTASADRSGSGNTSDSDPPEEDVKELEKSLKASLEGNYIGEA